ncbi:MAG: hypothetical protein H6577_02595 [Lewinellaceae bacterium]|nr:hypothetical protein [Saprospiraceae bacterium]MCB9336998.1 hypothetical protein [Lewinellaceae bacterium]
MKTNFGLLAVILLTLALVSCNKKTSNTVRDEPVTEQPPQPPPVDTEKEEAQQIVGFQKTPCFGKCPIYQVKIYADGKATWYGKMYVDRLGWFDATVKKEELNRIVAKARESGYFGFSSEYPTGPNKVADLPSTVTYVRMGDQEKQIKNTHDGPEKLDEFQKYLENFVMGLDWKPRPEKE